MGLGHDSPAPWGLYEGLTRALSPAPQAQLVDGPFLSVTHVISFCLSWALMCRGEGLAHLGPHLERGLWSQ